MRGLSLNKRGKNIYILIYRISPYIILILKTHELLPEIYHQHALSSIVIIAKDYYI